MNDKERDVGAYVASLLADARLGGQIAGHRLLDPVPPDFGENRLPWSRPIANLLAEKGIRLYSHQTEATDHIRAGHSIVAATPTASGKSLIYNLPVLDSYLRDGDTRALYLFPLKALAQDQLAAFRSLVSGWPRDARPEAALYDGDTSAHFRRKIRGEPPCALITNPEMLHLGILPHHAQWTTFLANLAYVIVDEAHTYRGVFGSHMAQVFRRLNRIAGIYGAHPTYIFCTATLGNPRELASSLMGGDDKPTLIDKSGAPQGPRHFLFIDPDSASSTCAIDLLQRALERNLRVIVYCRSRRMAELISMWASAEAGPYADMISPYRAGFLAEERRSIEARMASGELRAVISTSALELGIDIGGLDVCILVGYPGTIMQTLQRGGRVGRSRRESAVLLVAGEDALDQYFIHNPSEFFSRPPEKAVINPENEVILARHLECAAAERTLASGEPWLRTPAARKALATLAAQGLVLQTADGRQWVSTRKQPHRNVDLRGVGQTFVIENGEGQIIGLMDGSRAWREAHPGAVYIHRGKTWLIDELDEARMRIVARRAQVDWHTRVRGNKTTEILEELDRFSIGRCAIFRGRLRITDTITGYEKRTASGNRLLNITPLDAPPYIFETEGIWFVVPDEIRRDMEERFIHFMGSIHALEHAMIGLLPLEVMADRNDFGGISTPIHHQLGLPAVFVYDGLPGGAGLTGAAFGNARRILESVLQAIENCSCEDGCPSCVHSPKCGSGNRPLSKQGAVFLLHELLREGSEGDAICDSLKIDYPDAAPRPAGRALPPALNDREASSAPGEPATPVTLAEPGIHYVVFDVETRRSAVEVGGWHRADAMGVSVAVLYDSAEDEYYTYGQDNLGEMLERMRRAEVVVGFNSLRFDYRVLEPFAPGFNFQKLPSLDLLQKIRDRLNYRISLDNLARSTFDENKSSDGLQALRWWQEGKVDEIATYCRKDVELTRRLYLYGLQNGFLIFSAKNGQKARVPVNFTLN